MSDKRETKTITLPSGKKLEVKTYLTARERNAYRNIAFTESKIRPAADGKVETGDVSGEVLLKMERVLLESGITGYDGKTENCLERLLDGSPEDYDAAVVECGKISGLNFQRAK